MRKKLKQKVSVDFKDIGTKPVFDDIKRRDGQAGRLQARCRLRRVEQHQADLQVPKTRPSRQSSTSFPNKSEFGWIVVSDAQRPQRPPASCIIRKSTKGKERGYEAGQGAEG